MIIQIDSCRENKRLAKIERQEKSKCSNESLNGRSDKRA